MADKKFTEANTERGATVPSDDALIPFTHDPDGVGKADYAAPFADISSGAGYPGLDGNGNLVSSVALRTGTEDDLVNTVTDEGDGEVAVSTDEESLVVYRNGLTPRVRPLAATQIQMLDVPVFTMTGAANTDMDVINDSLTMTYRPLGPLKDPGGHGIICPANQMIYLCGNVLLSWTTALPAHNGTADVNTLDVYSGRYRLRLRERTHNGASWGNLDTRWDIVVPAEVTSMYVPYCVPLDDTSSLSEGGQTNPVTLSFSVNFTSVAGADWVGEDITVEHQSCWVELVRAYSYAAP